MKKFAETKDCRRQVLLDALGGEQAVCSGCDLCDKRRGIKKELYISDWEETYSMIKTKGNFYSENDVETELYNKMMLKDCKNIGVNIWNYGDSVDVVRQLKENGKIRKGAVVWKGKLRVEKSSKKKSS